MFNKLPYSILDSPSIHVFKRKVENWLFETGIEINAIDFPYRYSITPG